MTSPPLSAVLRLWMRDSGSGGWLFLALLVAMCSVAVSVALTVGAGTLAAAPGLSAPDLSAPGLSAAVQQDGGSGGGLLAGKAAAMLALPIALRWLGVGRVVLRYLERLAVHAATFRALAGLRVWLFRGVAASSAGGLGFRHAGDLASRLVADVEALDVLFPRVIVPLVGATLIAPVLLWTLAQGSALAALGVAGLYGLAAFALPAANARVAAGVSEALVLSASRLRIAALDAISGLPEVRAYGGEQHVLAAAAARQEELIAAQRRSAAFAAAADGAALLCSQGALLLVVAVLTTAQPGTAALLLPGVLLTLAAFDVASGLPRAGVLAGHATAAAARVVAAAADAGGTAARARPRSPEVSAVVPVSSGRAMSLAFQRVDFRWSQDRPAVFENLDLRIEPGSRVAVLGPSGSGKSTLAALALHLTEPQSGQVLIGGTPVRDLDVAVLRSCVAYLSQASHVFDDTVRGNLLLGRADATEAELWTALEQAALAETIRGLPDALDTWVGEGGARLSGGQRRRVALARVLLSRAPILILDEPGAGLDSETERQFLRALFDSVKRDRTLLLIAHRLTGAERIDRIWRLQGGQAVAATG